MRYVLSAAYGMGNVGDEAICDRAVANVLAVDPSAVITVLALNEDFFRQAHPRASYQVLPVPWMLSQIKTPLTLCRTALSVLAILRCDIFVWGGGGIIRNREYWLKVYMRPMRLALLFKKRVLVMSVGCERIDNLVVRKSLRSLRSVSAISVRDEESKVHLTEAMPELSGRIEVIPDDVIRMPTVMQQSGSGIFGVSICAFDGTIAAPSHDVFMDRMSAALRMLSSQTGLTVRLLPSARPDVRLCEKLRSGLAGVQCDIRLEHDPASFVKAAAECHAFVGMRMHACVLASSVIDLPVLCIAYSDKCRRLFRAAASEGMLLPDASAEELASAFTEFVDRRRAGFDPRLLRAACPNQEDWLRSALTSA